MTVFEKSIYMCLKTTAHQCSAKCVPEDSTTPVFRAQLEEDGGA